MWIRVATSARSPGGRIAGAPLASDRWCGRPASPIRSAATADAVPVFIGGVASVHTAEQPCELWPGADSVIRAPCRPDSVDKFISQRERRLRQRFERLYRSDPVAVPDRFVRHPHRVIERHAGLRAL